MVKNNLIRGFIRIGLVLYVIVWISLGIFNFYMASKNFWLVDAHFSPYLSYVDNVPMVFNSQWCILIAKEDFSSKSETDRMLIAEHFFKREIEPFASDYGYDTKKLKDWFVKYASSNIESIPIREFMFDPEAPKIYKYREIDLSKMPRRKFSYFFFQPLLFLYAFYGLLILYIPILIFFFGIRWIYLGFKNKKPNI